MNRVPHGHVRPVERVSADAARSGRGSVEAENRWGDPQRSCCGGPDAGLLNERGDVRSCSRAPTPLDLSRWAFTGLEKFGAVALGGGGSLARSASGSWVVGPMRALPTLDGGTVTLREFLQRNYRRVDCSSRVRPNGRAYEEQSWTPTRTGQREGQPVTSRRTLLKAAVVGAGALWVAPVVDSFTSPAAAASCVGAVGLPTVQTAVGSLATGITVTANIDPQPLGRPSTGPSWASTPTTSCCRRRPERRSCCVAPAPTRTPRRSPCGIESPADRTSGATRC